MGFERIRFAGFASTKQAVSASGNTIYSKVIQEDGKLRLEEITVGFDSILQASGYFSLYINGTLISDRIQPLSSISGYGFTNLHTWIYKGTKIEVTVQNTDSTNTGYFQVLASIYEEKDIPSELEKLQKAVLEKQLKLLGGV